MNDEITDEQFTNCHILADYLDALPDDYDKFKMECFVKFNSKREEDSQIDVPLFSEHLIESFHECGSSACALGHAPLAGIHFNGLDHDHFGNLSWYDYSDRCFIGRRLDYRDYIVAWHFVFSMSWPDCPKEAATRLRVFATTGVPETWAYDYKMRYIQK